LIPELKTFPVCDRNKECWYPAATSIIFSLIKLLMQQGNLVLEVSPRPNYPNSPFPNEWTVLSSSNKNS